MGKKEIVVDEFFMEKLNPRHKRFAEIYISNGFNASDAYRKVYKNKNSNTVCANAYKIKNMPNVKAYIKFLEKEIIKESISDLKEIEGFLNRAYKTGYLVNPNNKSGSKSKNKQKIDTKERIDIAKTLLKLHSGKDLETDINIGFVFKE